LILEVEEDFKEGKVKVETSPLADNSPCVRLCIKIKVISEKKLKKLETFNVET